MREIDQHAMLIPLYFLKVSGCNLIKVGALAFDSVLHYMEPYFKDLEFALRYEDSFHHHRRYN